MNLIRRIMDNGSRRQVAMLASGQFNLLRPENSPKGSLECLYMESSLALQKSGDASYELVVCRSGASGESPEDTDLEDEEADAMSVQSSRNDADWRFPVNPGLKFQIDWRAHQVVLTWTNTRNDVEEEQLQFQVSPEIASADVEQFAELVHRVAKSPEEVDSSQDQPWQQLARDCPEVDSSMLEEDLSDDSDVYEDAREGV